MSQPAPFAEELVMEFASDNLAASQESLEPSWLSRVAAVYLLVLSATGRLIAHDPDTAPPSARAGIEAGRSSSLPEFRDTPKRIDK